MSDKIIHDDIADTLLDKYQSVNTLNIFPRIDLILYRFWNFLPIHSIVNYGLQIKT